MIVITEEGFRHRVAFKLGWMLDSKGSSWTPWGVTGPGRSGAIASVYASHFLKIPFVPFGVELPEDKKGLLIVDTAMKSGRTVRSAMRKYEQHDPEMQVFYCEPPRVRFWYEIWEE